MLPDLAYRRFWERRVQDMGAWRLVGDIAGPLAACAVLVVMVWGAIDRGRVHRALAHDRELRKDAAALLAQGLDGRGLCGLLRAGLHLAAYAVLQCA